MSKPEFKITPEKTTHLGAVETLLDQAFGPGRFAKTAYRLREGVDPVSDLGFVGFLGADLVASIQFWPIKIAENTQTLLLGPLVVDPVYRGRGWGLELIATGLSQAKKLGYDLVILVGDEPYYARQGFKQVPPGQLTLPGPCDPQRLLYCELQKGVIGTVNGRVSKFF